MTAPLFPADGLAEADGGPRYLRLQAMIRAGIAEGRLRPDDALPAEREMAAHLGVSRVTVRKALHGLVDAGVLRRRHGSGTYVAHGVAPIEQPLSRLTSFTEDMRASGRVAGARWLERAIAAPTAAEAAVLGIAPPARVARLARLRFVDGEAVAIETAVVPEAALPDPSRVEGSLYDALAAVGMRPVRAVQRLAAVALGDDDAALLGVPAGAAAVAVERVSHLPDGSVIEFTRSLYRGDACAFVAELTLEPEPARRQGGATPEGRLP